MERFWGRCKAVLTAAVKCVPGARGTHHAEPVSLVRPSHAGKNAQSLYVFAERGISVLEGIRASFNEDHWPESLE